MDFKTSVSSYEEHEAILSDQLTAYQMAEPTSQQAPLCVLVKMKEPKIQWLSVRRQLDLRFPAVLIVVDQEWSAPAADRRGPGEDPTLSIAVLSGESLFRLLDHLAYGRVSVYGPKV